MRPEWVDIMGIVSCDAKGLAINAMAKGEDGSVSLVCSLILWYILPKHPENVTRIEDCLKKYIFSSLKKLKITPRHI